MFPGTRISLRQPGQRHDRSTLLYGVSLTCANSVMGPEFLFFGDQLAPGCTMEIVGQFEVQGRAHDHVLVTLANGLQVPAYKIASPCNGFCVCQDLRFKAAMRR